MPDSYRPLSASNAAAAQIQFSPDGRALVVTEKATNKIDVYQVDRDGLPEIAPQIVASAGQTPFGFSFGKHNRLFVTEAAGGAPGASSVSSYRLTRTGDLSLIDGPVATGLTAACWAVVTPDGRYTYIAETGSEAVSAFEINRRGDLSLRDANGITASTGAGSVPIDLAMSDNGRYLYSLSSKNHTLNEYRVEADGGLVAIGSLTNLPPSMNGLAAR
jgi:6-phosphogluconolactonase (cycloisomerase 2 family)